MPSFHRHTTRHQDVDVWMSIRLQFLRRVADRTLLFSHLKQEDCVQLNCNVAELFGFATWFRLTSGERFYSQQLQELLQATPAIPARFGVTSALLCLCMRVRVGFSFSAWVCGWWSLLRFMRWCTYAIQQLLALSHALDGESTRAVGQRQHGV